MKRKLVRITTVPLSLEKLLEGQLGFMSDYYEVIAVSSDRKRLEDYGRGEGVNTFYLPMTRKITPLRDLICVYKLYRFLKKEKPEIVHTHTPKAGIVGMMAAKLAKVPVRLHTVAGLPLMEARGIKRSILNAVEKKTYSYATKILPNSKGLKQVILNAGFCSSDKMEVLGEGSSNGIDCSYFSRQHFKNSDLLNKRKELGIPQDDKVVIFVGRIVKDKGIDELVWAFNEVQKEQTDCTLLLVGPFEDSLDPISSVGRGIIDTHPKIITTGYQLDVRIFLALSDFMAFPSYREGFPNVVMQAGAMELPVIASNINGCNEIIQDGENGILIPVKNREQLLSKMKVCLTDSSFMESLKKQSRNRIIGRFDRKKMWNIILEEYKRQATNL